MNMIGQLIKDARKIVIKIGSNVLSDDTGVVNKERMHSIVEQINMLTDAGKQVVVVSSGAGICGVGAINKWNRRSDINYKQALCAIGQVELMMAYKEYFADYGHHVGQILLTAEDFADPNRALHIRNTLFTLLDEGVIPIINENDSVCVDEIKIGDNDTLSARTAMLWSADLLIILSDIDGLFDKNPKMHSDAKLIECVESAERICGEVATDGQSSFGTGGMQCKLTAAIKVNAYGIPLVLLNGKQPGIIREAVEGTAKGTAFLVGQ